MSSFKKVLRECNVDCLHQVVENDGQRFLCFTRLGNSENSWIVVVTNGTDVWKNEYDEEGLEALSDLVNARTTDTFLTRFRWGVVLRKRLRIAFFGKSLHIVFRMLKIFSPFVCLYYILTFALS